jgi:hypothetical protein|eukprot:COSAG06_NODE_847_length_11974_cov_58.239158_13_plen_99_part_00
MSEENPTFEADTGKRGGESLMDTSTLLDLEQALTGLQDKSLSPAQAAETIRKEMQKQIMDAQNGTSSSKAPIDVHAAVRLALARLSETPTSWCVASFD